MSTVKADVDTELGFREPEEEPSAEIGGSSSANSTTLLCVRRTRTRLFLTLLGFCLAVRALEAALGLRPKGIVRVVLLPVRAVGCAEYAAVMAAPAVCEIASRVWRLLELPGSDGAAGQHLACVLQWAKIVSLGLLAVFAIGDVVVRGAFFCYAGIIFLLWIVRKSQSPQVRRLARTWAVFCPLIFEYKATAKWARHAGLSSDQQARAYSRLHEKYAPRCFQLLVDLGGVFVKIGQMLSVLPAGILPEPFMHEFKKLQSTVPPRPGSEVMKLVSEALGQPVESIFSRFDDVPIGSASIGQVHRARLAADGREVVVKVQYPEVSRTIEPDFLNCERVVWLLDKTRVEEVRDAKKHYINELDFVQEARNLERVRANLRKAFPKVRVPEPVMELCTPTVLVMTLISGTSLLDGIMHMAEAIARARGKSVDDLIAEFTTSSTDQEADKQPGALVEETKVAKGGSVRQGWRSKVTSALPGLSDTAKLRLLQQYLATSRSAMNVGVALYNVSIGNLGGSYLPYYKMPPTFDPVEMSYTIWRVHGHQLLIDGLFSTDPHPGNILIDGAGSLGLIDFGQVCDLALTTRLKFAQLLLALEADDDEQIARWHAELGMRSRDMSVELLSLGARMKFGDSSTLHLRNFERWRELTAKDPILPPQDDEATASYQGLGRAERLINILRGTSFILGVSKAHCPTTVWMDMARTLIAQHTGCTRAITIVQEDEEMGEEFFDAESDIEEGTSKILVPPWSLSTSAGDVDDLDHMKIVSMPGR